MARMGASPAQIAMLKKRQEKRGKGFSTGDDRVKPAPKRPGATRKALPPGKPNRMKTAAKAAKAAADIGSAIVRQRRGGTSKEAIGAPKKRGPAVSKPKQEKGPGSKSYDKPRRPIPKDRALGHLGGKTPDQRNRERILGIKPRTLGGTLKKTGRALGKAAGYVTSRMGEVPRTRTEMGKNTGNLKGPKKFGKSAS